MAAVQVVRAVGGEDGEAAGRAAGGGSLEDTPAEQEAEQVAGGLVRPVQVFEDQQQRGQVREVREKSGDALEELEAVAGVGRAAGPGRPLPSRRSTAGCAAKAGGEPVVGGGRAEDLREREIGQADVTEVHAVAGQDGHAGGVRVRGGLRQHAGLADAGVPGHQDGARIAGRGRGRVAEPGE